MPRTQPIHPWLVALLGLFMLLGFAVLAVRLWSLQVAQSYHFSKSLARQSLRSVRLPGIRGSVFDRNGVPLAKNRPSCCIEIFPEELRKPGPRQRTVDAVCDTLDRLAETMDVPRSLSANDVRTHLDRRTPLPLVAWRDLPPPAVARYAEHSGDFPGTSLSVEPVRVYPGASSACHLLGYVGRAADTNLPGLPSDGAPPEKFHYYLPEMAGRSGVEKRFDGVLRASSGGKLEVQIDATGFKFDEISRREPGRGSDVVLAVDSRIQAAAERVLRGQRGAAVCIDPRNGDVLALASLPGYDPNQFVPFISSSNWNRLLSDTNRPLLNRAVAGEYAPGSTFKPLTLLAALDAGAVTDHTVFPCSGSYRLGSALFHCASRAGHGPIDLRKAIRYSCNVYLFLAAKACGPVPIQEMAARCGFGKRTGISLDFERPGLVPTDAWKRSARKDAWREGDTCNLSIGQGALLVTPLQLALYCAAIANGGTLWQPRLVLGIRPPGGELREIAPAKAPEQPGWKRRHVNAVREGMRDVVNVSDGSGRRARLESIPSVVVAGKTGTAEYGVKGAGRKMTWFIAFAPYDDPRYALAMLVEDGASGGATVAPLAHDFFLRVFRDVEGLPLASPTPAPPPPPSPPSPEPPAPAASPAPSAPPVPSVPVVPVVPVVPSVPVVPEVPSVPPVP